MIHIFIINTVAGRESCADKIRERLSSITDIQYFIFSTRYENEESEIVRRALEIFEGEQLRFYVCGGAGTMHKILNGFENLDPVQIAYYPCGFSNDFIKAFGDDAERFYDLEELIRGDILDVDYIKTNHGIALNAFSFGLDSYVAENFAKIRPLKSISNILPALVSSIMGIMFAKLVDVDVSIDTVRINEKVSEVFFGNGITLNGRLFFDDHADLDDGRARVCILPPKRGLEIAPFFVYTAKKDIESLKEGALVYAMSRKLSVKSKNGEPLIVNMDGVLYKDFDEWEVEIMPKSLHLIVPRGVRI